MRVLGLDTGTSATVVGLLELALDQYDVAERQRIGEPRAEGLGLAGAR